MIGSVLEIPSKYQRWQLRRRQICVCGLEIGLRAQVSELTAKDSHARALTRSSR